MKMTRVSIASWVVRLLAVKASWSWSASSQKVEDFSTERLPQTTAGFLNEGRTEKHTTASWISLNRYMIFSTIRPTNGLIFRACYRWQKFLNASRWVCCPGWVWNHIAYSLADLHYTYSVLRSWSILLVSWSLREQTQKWRTCTFSFPPLWRLCWQLWAYQGRANTSGNQYRNLPIMIALFAIQARIEIGFLFEI